MRAIPLAVTSRLTYHHLDSLISCTPPRVASPSPDPTVSYTSAGLLNSVCSLITLIRTRLIPFTEFNCACVADTYSKSPATQNSSYRRHTQPQASLTCIPWRSGGLTSTQHSRASTPSIGSTRVQPLVLFSLAFRLCPPLMPTPPLRTSSGRLELYLSLPSGTLSRTDRDRHGNYCPATCTSRCGLHSTYRVVGPPRSCRPSVLRTNKCPSLDRLGSRPTG